MNNALIQDGADQPFNIARIGPILDQMQSAQMKLTYAIGQVNCGNSAQVETVYDTMRDITHSLAHLEGEVFGE